MTTRCIKLSSLWCLVKIALIDRGPSEGDGI